MNLDLVAIGCVSYILSLYPTIRFILWIVKWPLHYVFPLSAQSALQCENLGKRLGTSPNKSPFTGNFAIGVLVIGGHRAWNSWFRSRLAKKRIRAHRVF